MRKPRDKKSLPLTRPGDDLHPGFAGILTIAPSKIQKSKKIRPVAPEARGWKPKGKWLVSLKRGSGTGGFDRMIRGCDSLEDGRKTAEDYFKSGWDEAWVYEKL